ncbi:MAG: cohesin domain-containing protein, partial [Pyrinomonadaceae bacterium]
TITGSANAQTTTDASGNYSFGVVAAGGSYVITPTGLGKIYDPITRTYTNVNGNITNANFVAYDQAGPNAVPREVRPVNTVATPGSPVTVPLEAVSLGNETSFAFSLNFDTALLGIPTIVCGTSTPGCAVTINTSQPGKAGITIIPAGPMTAGIREVARLTFPTNLGTATSTPLSFGDVPTVRDVRNTEGNPVPAFFRTGNVSFIPDLEGDVVSAAGTAPGGDGVLSNDVTIARQMVLGLITPTAQQFRNADSAPRTTLGDGCPINATDVTQAGRYNLGLDPPTAAGGPATPVPGGCIQPTRNESPDSPEVGRVIRAVNMAANPGQTITVSFQLDSQGDEASTSFTANWNPAVFTYVSAAAGAGVPTGTNLGLNTTQTAQGRLGVLLDSTNTYAAGTRQILNVTFTVAANAPVGTFPVTFSSAPTAQSVSSAQGALLATTYENGNIVIGQAAAGVTVSGRVTTAGGQGLRNAVVTMTDAEGHRRTTSTGSFGIYTFEQVEAGRSYIVSVTSKRFRFAARAVNVTDSFDDVNFVGLE